MPRRSKQIYLGTMSGTSMDGLDLVAVEFNNNKPHLLHQQSTAYPAELRESLQSIALRPDATVTQMCRLDTQLGQFYSDTINAFMDDYKINHREVSAIGSHGQTVRHSPQDNLPYTLQIGDPNIIAARTGLNVVADFRRRDLALGGQGAPLTPAFHNQVFRSDTDNRVIINIGGIANITNLPADMAIPVTGFDTGPGNTFLDQLSRQHLYKDYDHNGDFAHQGKIHFPTVESMLEQEPYFHHKPPKSTGTDYFSPTWLKKFRISELAAPDAMATMVELTALSLSQGIQSLETTADECFVCGGGAHNSYLLERLKHHLNPIKVNTTDQLGVHPDWVEAMAFAWLARQTLRLLPGNLPSVTNAENATILGGIYFSHRQH